MGRKVFDCRHVPGEINTVGCVFAVIGKDEDEVVEAQMKHGHAVHGAEDTPETRAWIRALIVDEEEWIHRRLEETTPAS